MLFSNEIIKSYKIIKKVKIYAPSILINKFGWLNKCLSNSLTTYMYLN